MKKRYFPATIVAIVLFLCALMPFSLGDIVFADCAGVDTSIIDCTSKDGSAAIQEVLWNGLDIFSAIVGILGIVGVTIVGIQYIRAAGNEQQTTKAKRRMYEIVIGLGVYALAFAGLKWLNVSPSKSAEMESISVSSSNVTVAKGNKVDLKPSVYPLNADAKVTCEIVSGGEKYASVNEKTCVVTSKKKGTAKVDITAKQGDKVITKTVTVKVTKAEEKKDDSGNASNNTNNTPPSEDGNWKKFGTAIAVMHAGKKNPISDVSKAIKEKWYAVECDLQYVNNNFYCHHDDDEKNPNTSGWTKFIPYITAAKEGGMKIVLDMSKYSYSNEAIKKLAAYIKNNNLADWLFLQENANSYKISQMKEINKLVGKKMNYWLLTSGSKLVRLSYNNREKLKKLGATTINLYDDMATLNNIKKFRNAGFDVGVCYNPKSKDAEFSKHGVKYIMHDI